MAGYGTVRSPRSMRGREVPFLAPNGLLANHFRSRIPDPPGLRSI
jgi:hypothetical protein